MKKRYFDLNTYFKSIYGQRVHKLTVDAGLSCPNRDGTLSTGGCIYCNAKGSGTGAYAKGLSITQQLLASKSAVARRFKAGKFIAYFQSFTNTYAPVGRLQAFYDEALAVDDVVGLAIGTRPDCVGGPVLELLEEYARNRLIWLEYGLQSAHDRTLSFINRGHDSKSFVRAVTATQGRGIRICAHVILGLPGETPSQMLETADFIGRLGIDGVKLHLLYVVKGSPMEALYRSDAYQPLSQAAYVDIVCDFLSRLPEQMVIQRLTSDPHPRELVAPGWSMEKRETLAMIHDNLEKRDIRQGCNFRR